MLVSILGNRVQELQLSITLLGSHVLVGETKVNCYLVRIRLHSDLLRIIRLATIWSYSKLHNACWGNAKFTAILPDFGLCSFFNWNRNQKNLSVDLTELEKGLELSSTGIEIKKILVSI